MLVTAGHKEDEAGLVPLPDDDDDLEEMEESSEDDVATYTQENIDVSQLVMWVVDWHKSANQSVV